MKRRDFIRVSSAAGIVGLAGRSFDSFASPYDARVEGFDLHPFIKEHPEAVFINLTSVKEKTDAKDIYDAAFKLSTEMFVKTRRGKGYPNSTKITCKPNWTSSRIDRNDPTAHLGITTDNNYVEGFLNGVKTKGPQEFYLRECASPNSWAANGYVALAERNNFDLKNLSTMDFWELGDEIIFNKIDGVVFKEAGYMAPMTA